jgi:hypothetical protein
MPGGTDDPRMTSSRHLRASFKVLESRRVLRALGFAGLDLSLRSQGSDPLYNT